MSRLISLLAVTALVAANTVHVRTASAQTAPHPYALPKAAPVYVEQAPEWFLRLPPDTTDMLFAAGTAQSMDEQMAYDKARLQAERKLVEMMSSKIRSLVKSNRSDNGDSMTESTTIAIQKFAEAELVGAQRVDSYASFDGRRYKVYVLLRLPLAEHNPLRRERELAQSKREAELRAARAQQELEAESRRRSQEAEAADIKLRNEIGPKPETAPPAAQVAPISTPTPAVTGGTPATLAPTTSGSIRLLDVDNEEYKKRRAEALAKPNAVIGQITYQTN